MGRTLAALAPLLLFACASGELRPAPTGKHPSEGTDLVIVDYPPPPAEVEQTGDPPSDERCVWLDGYWDWMGRRWEWQQGAWVIPPAGCYYAPRIIVVWVPSKQGGLLYYGTPRWYPREAAKSPKGKAPACPPPRPCEEETNE